MRPVAGGIYLLFLFLMASHSFSSESKFERTDLAYVRALEKALERDEGAGSMYYYNLYHERLVREAKKLVLLEVDGKTFEAADVIIGHILEKDFGIHGPSADYTIHITEFPHNAVDVRDNSKVRLLVYPGYEINISGPYLGDPELMHATGYSCVKKVKERKNGYLKIDSLAGQGPVIFFVITREKSEKYHRKYIWVLRYPEHGVRSTISGH